MSKSTPQVFVAIMLKVADIFFKNGTERYELLQFGFG